MCLIDCLIQRILLYIFFIELKNENVMFTTDTFTTFYNRFTSTGVRSDNNINKSINK